MRARHAQGTDLLENRRLSRLASSEQEKFTAHGRKRARARENKRTSVAETSAQPESRAQLTLACSAVHVFLLMASSFLERSAEALNSSVCSAGLPFEPHRPLGLRALAPERVCAEHAFSVFANGDGRDERARGDTSGGSAARRDIKPRRYPSKRAKKGERVNGTLRPKAADVSGFLRISGSSWILGQ